MGRLLQLVRRWELGPQLSSGGFGRVFEAIADDGGAAVVKMVPKVPGAERELLFEDLRGARNVVPILDRGESNGSWVIVMPRADRSLRDRLDEAGGALPLEEAALVIRDVVEALADIAGRVVHRDIKPENTLLFAGHWCLADFGIARYAEASTAPDTRKLALTPAYAAPERWRSEHATAACDIYSLGVMAFELLSGGLPFRGPRDEDFRTQHLTQSPPPVPNATPLLASLITECLFKAPEARPTAANLSGRLQVAMRPAVGAAARLQEANRMAVERAAVRAAQESAAQIATERRRALLADASMSYETLNQRFRQTILEAAPAAHLLRSSRGQSWAVQLNEAVLELGALVPTAFDAWGDWAPAFDVVAHSSVGIRIPRDRHAYEGRAHSLWYCDARTPGVFRWYETAFMVGPLFGRRGLRDPFALDPGEDAAKALGAGISSFAVAWPFTPVDQGDDADFLEHWADWFARAALGELAHPPGMPERQVDGSWRRGPPTPSPDFDGF